MKCPRCGGENCQYVTTSETYSKGFSSGDACCGLLLLGPAGLLCGLCGSESSTKVKEYWVCHDCGNKFNSNKGDSMEGLSQILPPKFKARFYRDVFGESVLQQNNLWNQVQVGYQKCIAGTVLEPYFLQSVPPERNKVYLKLMKKCVKVMKMDVDIFFAVTEDKGLLFLPKGLFINDCFIANPTIKSIFIYSNIIFINRIAFELNTVQEAGALFVFLEFLYPQVASGKEKTMEGVVEKLYSLENMNHSDSGEPYFHKNQQYIDYVEQMTADYVGCCLKLHPEVQYDKYQKVKKKQNLLLNVLLGTQAVLAVVLLLVLGIWGLLISGIIFAGYIVWLCKITSRNLNE